jgi:hypothetical protein
MWFSPNWLYCTFYFKRVCPFKVLGRAILVIGKGSKRGNEKGHKTIQFRRVQRL